MKSIVVTILLITSFVGAASSQSKETQKTRTIIAGHFTNHRTDTLTLLFFQQRLGSSTIGSKILRDTAPDGRFKIELSAFTGLVYFRLSSLVWPRLYLENYLLEPGDSIYVTIAPDGIPVWENILDKGLRFSGRNFQKYQAKYQVDSAQQAFTKEMYRKGPPPNFIQHRFDSAYWDIENALAVLRNIRLGILKKYKPDLPRQVYETMLADIWYQSGLSRLTHFSISWDDIRRKKGTEKAAGRLALLDCFKNQFFPEIEYLHSTESGRAHSWAYMEYMVIKAALGASINRIDSIEVDALSYIRFLDSDNKSIRDKAAVSLVASLYSHNSRARKIDQLLDSLLHTPKDPFLFSVLSYYQSVMLKGKPLYAFRLPDSKGNIIKLEDLRGKTLLIDFWFTGCIPCKKIAKRIPELRKLLNDTAKFRFVSICTDKEKTRWLKSLTTYEYTDEENLNLYTAGEGSDHPFLRYYGISAVPRLLVVDPLGRLYTAVPPFPDTPENTRKLASILQEASRVQ